MAFFITFQAKKEFSPVEDDDVLVVVNLMALPVNRSGFTPSESWRGAHQFHAKKVLVSVVDDDVFAVKLIASADMLKQGRHFGEAWKKAGRYAKYRQIKVLINC